MTIRKAISDTIKTGLAVLVVSYAIPFSTVAMEKHIAGYDKKQAALVNSLSAVPVLYDVGFHLGHRFFYDDQNFIETAEEQIGSKNLIPRPHLLGTNE